MPRNNRQCWAIARRGRPHQCPFRARFVFVDGNTQMLVCGVHRSQLEDRGAGKWRLAAHINWNGSHTLVR